MMRQRIVTMAGVIPGRWKAVVSYTDAGYPERVQLIAHTAEVPDDEIIMPDDSEKLYRLVEPWDFNAATEAALKTNSTMASMEARLKAAQEQCQRLLADNDALRRKLYEQKWITTSKERQRRSAMAALIQARLQEEE